MTRNLKLLGLALVAALAVSAVAAQAATAAEHFHTHAEYTVLTGEADPTEPTWRLTLYNAEATEEIGSFRCDELKLEGLQTGAETEPGVFTSEEATLHPTYPLATCESALGGVEEINTGGCHYRFGAETDAEGHASTEILGCANGGITTKISGCTIQTPNQLLEGGVHYTNENEETSEKALTATMTAKGRYTSSGFICALGGIPAEGHFTYDGKATLKGYEYIEGTTGSYEDGQQVGIWWE